MSPELCLAGRKTLGCLSSDPGLSLGFHPNIRLDFDLDPDIILPYGLCLTDPQM